MSIESTNQLFWREFQTVCVGGLIFWCIARIVHLQIGRIGDKQHVHGMYIPEWILGVYLAGGLGGLILLGPAAIPAPPSFVFASLGLLLGLALGWIHGSFRLARHQRGANDRSNVQREFPEEKPLAAEDGNPYRPPNLDP